MGEIAETNMYEYLDGPRFCRWLESEGVDLTALSDSQIRRVRDWKLGSRANIYSGSVDKIITDHYLSISRIPDEVFADNQKFKMNPGTNNKLSNKARLERKINGEILLMQGNKTMAQISEEIGVSITTLGKWKRSLRRRELISTKD